MTRVLLGSLVALAALGFTLTAQDKGKPKDEKPMVSKPDTLAEMVKRYEVRQRRLHGAKLSITATASDKPREVQVNWEIDYDGPRPPFTILPPDLEFVTNGYTKLYVYYETADGKPGEYHFPSRFAEGPIVFFDEQFVTAKKDVSKVEGKIVLSAEQLKKLPSSVKIENAYFYLYHWATERGTNKLDAWTGDLHSNIAPVSKK